MTPRGEALAAHVVYIHKAKGWEGTVNYAEATARATSPAIALRRVVPVGAR